MNQELALLFFLLYIASVIIIGVVASRKESEDDFMIANRKLSGFQVAATMAAGFFDGSILAIYIAFIYQYGLSAIWAIIGLALGFLFLRNYAGKIKKKADEMKVYSMPEYFFRILGKRNGLMFSLLLIGQFFLILVVNLIVSGKVLSAIFQLNYSLSVVIGGIIILIYLLLAGFKAVVKTDFFQLMIMLVMCLTVAIVLFGKTTIPSSSLNLGDIGTTYIIGFLILGTLGIMTAPDLWQRIFATKDEQQVKKGLGYSAGILFVLALIISILGFATKQFFPNILPEDALITGFSQLLPFGLKEFGMVLLYAVALSSSDTVTFVVSSILTRDVKNYTKKYHEASMKKLTRLFILFFIAFAVLIALVFQDVLTIGFSIASLNITLFPVVFGSLYWRLKKKAVFYSLLLALISVAGLLITKALTPETAALPFGVALVSLIIFQKAIKKAPKIQKQTI